MDFIFNFLANYYWIFLILGIFFAVALLGVLSKVTKRKQEKNEMIKEIKKEEAEEEKQSKLSPTIESPESTMINSKRNEEEIFIEPSLDNLEAKTSNPEPIPMYTQPTYNIENIQPIPYIDTNVQYMEQAQNPQYNQEQYAPQQYIESNANVQQPMITEQGIQTQQIEQSMVEEPALEILEFTTDNAKEVGETIEFFDLSEQPKEKQVPDQESVGIRKFDINQARAKAEELASKQSENTPGAYDAEPTFGLVIEDTGSSVGTDV